MEEKDPCKSTPKGTSATPMEVSSEEQAEESLEERIALAQSRSGAYGFLAAVFKQLPDQEFVSSLLKLDTGALMMASDASDASDSSSDAYSDGGEILPGETVLDEDSLNIMQEGFLLIKAYQEASSGKSLQDVELEIAQDRTRLLRGIKPGYGPPPPYESVYIGTDGAPETQVHAQIRKAYASVGAGVAEEVKESPDYIGIELDFMRYLTQKESQAWEEHRLTDAFDLLRSQEAFLKEHLILWVSKFCQLMFKEARIDFYRGIARVTEGFVSYEADKITEYLG